MISSIELVNVQRHKKKTIEFVKGLNIIRGGNQRGKSTIVRSIFWMFANRPLGDWMIRDEESFAKVVLFLNGHKLKRIKGKNRNLIMVDGESFTDLKSNIPDPIARLGIKPITVAKQQLWPNIAFTRDDYELFLIPVSGTIKYGILSYLTECDVIERVIAQYKKIAKDASVIRSGLEARILEINEKLEELQNLDMLVGVVQACGTLQGIHQGVSEKNERVASYWHEYRQLKKVNGKMEPIVNELEKVQIDAQVLLVRVDEYFSRLNDLYKLQSTMKKTTHSLHEKIEGYKKLQKDVEEIQNLKEEFDKVISFLVSLEEFASLRHIQNVCIKEIENLKKELGEIKVCPTCGQDLMEYNHE